MGGWSDNDYKAISVPIGIELEVIGTELGKNGAPGILNFDKQIVKDKQQLYTRCPILGEIGKIFKILGGNWKNLHNYGGKLGKSSQFCGEFFWGN